VRYPFSRLTVLHGFFQDLNFHRLLAQKALKLPDLLQAAVSSAERNFLSSRNGGEAAFLILLLPLKQQAGLDTMQAGDMETFIPGSIVCWIMAIFS
jgi:hypothetical protein